MQFTCNLYAAYYRRKFRSQTFDKMDRWNAEMGRVREEKRREEKRGEEKRRKRREEKRREEKRREEERESQKKEDPGARKGIAFFQWFVAPEGRKVGSLKRRVQSQLARWEMKNCTPLWCEAHLPVKKLKTLHVRSTFRSCDVEKAHAVVARSTFRSQNVQKHTRFGQLLKVEMSKKCTPLWREAHFEVKMWKAQRAPMSFRMAGARDCAPCQKWAKREGFVAFPKTMAGVVHLKRICKDFMCCGRRSTRDMFIRAVRRSGRWFFWEGLHFGASDLQVCLDDFAWQVQHFVWSGITFSWQAQYFRQAEWKNLKTHWHEAVSSALNFPFLKDVSQNCFVFDAVN